MKKFAILLLIIGIFLRLYQINLNPPHLSNDEISIAYDAYSIANSLKDEHGTFLPLSFASYGTYKAPLYIYTLAPLVRLFDNTQAVVRLPSIIAGLLTILVTGLITYQLTSNRKIALWSSALLSITPWHIYASRMAWETNLALLFFTLGIWLMMKQKLFLSSLTLVLSMYAYHTEWLLVPLFVFIGGFFYFKKDKWKFWILSFLLAFPLGIDYLLNAGPDARAKTELIWSASESTFFGVLVTFIRNYIDYFNPKILFLDGLNILPKDNPFTPGLLLWPTIIPIIIGFKKTKNRFFRIWLFLSPLTAALTWGDYSLMRNLNMVIPLIILASVGLAKMGKIWWSLTLLTLFNFVLIYFWHFPKELGEAFQSYRPVAYYLKDVENNASEIHVDYRYGNYRFNQGPEYIGIPYLYLAFFQKWDPSVTQTRIVTDQESRFGKYVIKQVDWNGDIIRPGRYFVVSVSNPPLDHLRNQLEEVAAFHDSSGKRAFEIWQVK